ncbi:hypothetical protein, conserved [Eimeria necatrix]|uniref:Uncharacterized protein n=1 Tax=Eimeria necatrix TaxID=51315 RepID=U6N5I9_9EIME|nr:hypothetical protein, conserved [Eimeria necatrix]CDJ69175.1 hypothetical protein, conserved [Eimeria necatrix]
MMSESDAVISVDRPLIGHAASSSRCSISTCGSNGHIETPPSPTAAAAAGATAAAPTPTDETFVVSFSYADRYPVKQRRHPSSPHFEEKTALIEDAASPTGLGQGIQQRLWPFQGLCPERKFLRCMRMIPRLSWVFLAAVPVVTLLAWGCWLVWVNSRMQIVFAAEKAAAAAAAAAAEKPMPYSHISSDSIRGLAAIPAAPRALSCWDLQQYELPVEQEVLQQQRDEPYSLLHADAAAVVPSAADIIAAAPWERDARDPSFAVPDWAVRPQQQQDQQVPAQQQQQQQQQQQPVVSVCTYRDPRYGVTVTALLASLVASPENGCTDTCALPFWNNSPESAQKAESGAEGAPEAPRVGLGGPLRGTAAAASAAAAQGPKESPAEAPELCLFSEPSLYNGCNTIEGHLAAQGVAAPSRDKGVKLTGTPEVDAALLLHGGLLRRRVLHFVSGSDALTPRELWALDSAFAAMPGALVRWHVIPTCRAPQQGPPEEGPPHGGVPPGGASEGEPGESSKSQYSGGGETTKCLERARETHFAQMQIFWRSGYDLQYVQHDRLDAYFQGLPLERHAEVLSRQPLGPAAQLQRVLQHMLRTLTADVLRLAVVYREGGTYMDTDVVSVQELRHLSNFVACEGPEGLTRFSCDPCQAVISFEAGHERLREWLVNVALLLDNDNSTSTGSEGDSGSSGSSSSSLWRRIKGILFGADRSIWSWDGRAGKSLGEMLAANDEAEKMYKQRSSSNSSYDADRPFAKMLLLPWGTVGTKPLRLMLDMWSKEGLPHLDARRLAPSLHTSVTQLQQQQQQQQQGPQKEHNVYGSPWPGLTRILGKAPLPSSEALKEHLRQSWDLQQQRRQKGAKAPEQKPQQQVGSVVGRLLQGISEGVSTGWTWLLALTGYGPYVNFGQHVDEPANNAEPPSSLSLYGPTVFFPLSYTEVAWDRPAVTAELLWSPARAPEGVAFWEALVAGGHVYTLHLYSTMIHYSKGDFSKAIQDASHAAIGVIQRSYCSLLCGASRLQVFGGPESSREIPHKLSELAKVWLRYNYNI